MCRKVFALVLSFSLLLPRLFSQDLSPEDWEIIAKQEQIISIAQSLNESVRISEQNLQAEREAWQKEKSDLLKEKESWPNYEKDIATLNDSLKKQSESLNREQKRADALANGCRILAIAAAAFGFYAIIK